MAFYARDKVVEAKQWTGFNHAEMVEFCTDAEGDGAFLVEEDQAELFIEARNEWKKVPHGIWVIKSPTIMGFYPKTDEKFNKEYRPI